MVSMKSKTEELPRGIKYAMELQQLVYEYVEKETNASLEKKFKATGALIIFFNADKETHLICTGLISWEIAMEHILTEKLKTCMEKHE